MRFPDTYDGWLSQMNELLTNRNVNNYLKAISSVEPMIVRNRKSGITGNQPEWMCHKNVAKFVRKIGGSPLFGWLVYPYQANDNTISDGVITSMFHCNWLTPEGNVVNATPMKHSFHIFLPDPK